MISTLSTNDVCARVRTRWGGGLGVADVPRAEHNIALCIAGGLERLGRAIKDTTDRNLLTKSINATPSAGVIDLSVAAFKNILIDTYRIPGNISTQAESSAVFSHAPSSNAMRAATPVDTNHVWFNLSGKQITFKHPTTGAFNTYATPLTLQGSYIPTLDDSTLPMVVELEDQLIDRVSEIVKQFGGLSFLNMDDDLAAERIRG